MKDNETMLIEGLRGFVMRSISMKSLNLEVLGNEEIQTTRKMKGFIHHL